MKKSLLLSILFLLLFSNLQLLAQSKIVAPIDSIYKIEISKKDVKSYLKKFESMTSFEVVEMKVSNKDRQNFLLVKCKVNDVESWVYIVELKPVRNKLVIKKGRYLNACKSDVISMDNFRIDQGKINGCIKHNHKIIRR